MSLRTSFVVTRDRTGNGRTRPDDEANAKSPARLTTSLEGKDGKKDERMYGESFKPGSHRDSSHRRTRHLRERREQEGEKDVGGWSTPAPWRTFLERFETRRPSSDERTGKRNERAKQTHRTDEASTIWEMKCRGIGKV